MVCKIRLMAYVSIGNPARHTALARGASVARRRSFVEAILFPERGLLRGDHPRNDEILLCLKYNFSIHDGHHSFGSQDIFLRKCKQVMRE